MSTSIRLLFAFLAATIAAPDLAHAVTVGQSDTFDDGTTMGWHAPGPNPNSPLPEPGGGPTGPGDGYLMLRANGQNAAGGRLSALNDSQWTGDYLAAGVSLIRMNVNNQGPDDLSLRLLFEDFDTLPGPPLNLALSATAVFVPAGSGWTTIEFPISPADLVNDGIGSVTAALSNTDTLRIFHNTAPSFPGPGVGIPIVVSHLGIDNITAVPEPNTILILLPPLLTLLSLRSSRSASISPNQ
jgi:hypothetical protein